MFFTQSGFSPSVISTSGNATNDATDGSHGSLSTILTASSPFESGCAFDHLAASANSSGYVVAMNSCDSSESGYSATCAVIWSSCSLVNGFASCACAVTAESDRDQQQRADQPR